MNLEHFHEQSSLYNFKWKNIAPKQEVRSRELYIDTLSEIHCTIKTANTCIQKWWFRSNKLTENSASLSPKFPLLSYSASGNVQSNRAWVVILEVVQGGIATGLQLKRYSSVSWASKSCYGIRIAWSNSGDPIISLDGWGIVICGWGRGNTRELGEINTSITRECIGGGLKLGLFWEEEDQTASLSGIRGWDIEVEYWRGGRVNY